MPMPALVSTVSAMHPGVELLKSVMFMPDGPGVTRFGTASLSGDDSALPEAERAVLERARALIPRLAERAPAATAARKLPAETIAEYREAGIMRILQPRRFGGMQGRFSLFSRIVEELTYGCASSAWVYAVLAEHQWIVAQYPEQAQIDVWGDDPEAVASSSLAPRAAAKRVPGGWRLSGRYPFSSGCDYAQWAILGAFLGEAGDPRTIAYALAPLSEIEIVDDWQTLGLAGTGSKSLLLHDVFVPEHRTVMVADLFAGTPPGALVHPEYPVLRAPRGFSGVVFAAAGLHRAGPTRPRHRLHRFGGPGVARNHQSGRIRSRADGDRRGCRRDRCRDPAAPHRARLRAPPRCRRAAVSPRPRRCARAAIWSTRSIRWAGRSSGCVKWTAPAGSMTATNWARSAATS